MWFERRLASHSRHSYFFWTSVASGQTDFSHFSTNTKPSWICSLILKLEWVHITNSNPSVKPLSNTEEKKLPSVSSLNTPMPSIVQRKANRLTKLSVAVEWNSQVTACLPTRWICCQFIDSAITKGDAFQVLGVTEKLKLYKEIPSPRQRR